MDEIINKVKNELSGAENVSGLCYYASNNVCFDLSNLGITSEVFNIRDMAMVDYDHYFVVAKPLDDYYLVDLTFEQFTKKEGHELRFSDEWPVTELKSSLNGKMIADNLLNNGYSLITNDDFSLYLKCFNPEFECFFTLDDLMPSRIR